MAKDKGKALPGEGAGEEPPKKKGKLKLLIVIALLLAIGGGGAAWFFLQQEPHAATAKVEAPKPPVFVTLEPFTVNLAGESSERYLQVGMDFKVADSKVVDAVKLHMPEIRNGLLLVLSSKRAEDISTVEGKQKLSAEILVQANKPIGAKAPGQGVVGVFFTSFVIQ
jgi:flagellar FliL protein